MAFLILSQISVGAILMLLWLPIAKLGRGFFSFHAGLALALEVIAHAITRDVRELQIHAPYGISLLASTLLFQLRRLRWATPCLRFAAALGVFALAADAWRINGVGFGVALPAILTSAMVTGALLVTMNLGHWYLVIRGLPIELLGIANKACVAALLLRIATILAGAAMALDAWKHLIQPSAGPVWDTVLFLTVRVSFGLAAPLILAWMIHECVKIKSNQSATGILYVSVVFILIGEMSGTYFLLERGVPL